MSGHDDSHVDRNGAIAADPLHLPLFQDAQEFGLHHERHVADLIEEERAFVRLLELSNVTGGGAGEAALLMAEQFRFNQFARHRCAVQCDKGTILARTSLMQRAGDQFLSRTGLAEDAHACLAGSDAVDLRHHTAHSLAGMHNLVLADALPQFAILGLQPFQLEDIVDGEQQLVGG